MLVPDSTVFIRAKFVPRHFGNGMELRVSDIQYLQTIKEQHIERLTISVDSDALDDEIVNDLSTIISQQQAGVTQIFFQIRDSETNRPVTLHARGCVINIGRDLISFLNSNPQMEYSIN